MPDIEQIFREVTENVRPDPGALERQHGKQRWQVAKQKTGVYTLVAGFVIAGIVFGISALRKSDDPPHKVAKAPGTGAILKGLPPTAERLAGIWLLDNEPLLAQFTRDGTYTFDNIGLLDTDPAAAGTYELNGRIISFANERGRGCPDGDRWAWRAGLTQGGKLHVLHVDKAEVIDDVSDDCDEAGEWRWTRVSPSSQVGVQISAQAPARGGPPSTESALRGIWLLEGHGFLLRFGVDGTYAIDDEGGLGADPDDVGTFEVDGRGGVTLTSGGNSRTCAQGDQWIWENVRLGEGTLRGVVAESECPNDAGVDLTWVRLSP